MVSDPNENMYFGKDCPQGMVQVEFVITHSEKAHPNGWKPSKRATVDIYIDGERFHITVGDFHDGRCERRGIEVCGPMDLQVKKTSINACSIFRADFGKCQHCGKPAIEVGGLCKECEDGL